jgi:hypothetical protein
MTRRCGACDQEVTVRYTFEGEPVFWTCERHGILDADEVHSRQPAEVSLHV